MPPDLKHCHERGKVMGDHEGWSGPHCFCGESDTVREAKPGDPWATAALSHYPFSAECIRWRHSGIISATSSTGPRS
jgi:hypothetical protein